MFSRRNLIILLVVLLLAGAGGAYYWGYCWGWWGRESMLLAWLLQCKCPALSEEHRYPARVDVLASACVNPGLGGISPSGRYVLIVYHKPLPWWEAPVNLIALEATREPEVYLLDLQAGVQTRTDLTTGGLFLTDTELVTIATEGIFVVDLVQRIRVPIRRAEDLPEARTADNKIDLPSAVEVLKHAERVYLRPGRPGVGDVAVGLAEDYQYHPDQSFILGYRLNSRAGQIEQLLSEKGIRFERLRAGCGAQRCVSRDGLLAAYALGIYALADDELDKLLVPNYGENRNFYQQEWLYEDSGVVLTSSGAAVIGGPGSFTPIQFLPVPQPILKLKVPEAYLSSAALERERVQQRKEALGTVIAWGVPLGVAAAGGLVWRRRRGVQRPNQAA